MAFNNNNNGNCGTHSDAGSSESSGGRLGVGGGGGGGPDGLTLKKGPWTAAEDKILMEYVRSHGEGNWNAVQRNSGLNRCGKSCRLRWANHLRPNLKKGAFSPEEERLILELHAKYGNKWARMAAQLPGRTDNEIKNYWNTRVKRRKRQGLPLYPGDIQQAQPNTPTSPMAPTTPTTPTTPTFQFQTQNQNQSHSHNHNHFSLSPTAQSFPSSLSPTNQSMTSPNLFEPISFSFSNPFTFQRPTPLLSTPLRFRRYHESNSFSLPLSTLTSQNSTLLGYSTPTQMPNIGSFQFPMNFNPTLPLTMTTQFETDPIGLAGLIGSVKSELPSTQFSQIQSDMTTDSNLCSSSTQRNIGLLDDLLEEAHAYMHAGDSSMNAKTGLGLKEEKPSLDDYSRFGSSSSYLGPTEMNIREEANQQQFASTSATEEWSKLLSFIPSSSNMQVTEWYNNNNNNNNNNNSDSGKISNKNVESIGVTEENLGLEMQRLASSLVPVAASSLVPVAASSATDHGRVSGSWDNLPGIC